MKAKILLMSLCSLLVMSGCSKPVAKTSAKLKLNLSKIVNFSSGIGSGGAILFGRSGSGEHFGKFITSSEENLDLPNGSWSFYAVMWEKVTNNFDGKAYCGRSDQNLNGQAVSVSLNLNNGNCADPVFAGSDGYVSSGIQKFSQLWLEECDELNGTGSKTCMRDNQGSAVSYRFAFKNYKRAPGGAFAISNEAIFSKCKTTTTGGIFEQDTGINFPTGNGVMPFIISVEMFLKSSDCGVSIPETKGVYTYTFMQGLGSDTASNKIVKSEVNYCMPDLTTEAACLPMLGMWSGSSCAGVPAVVYNFNNINCGANPSNALGFKAIKQMVAIPKNFLCRFNDSINVGRESFPGGTGNIKRPFKICNEWQMNQVGEYNSDTSTSDNFKLMNDLDMNRAGISGYPAPLCAGQLEYDLHMNMNPIDKINCYGSSNPQGYYGTFNGNNKIIKNARINSDDSALHYMGFSRQLSGVVKDLNFMGLDVRAADYVGGIAGKLTGTNATIKNVRIDKIDAEGDLKVGAVAGYVDASTFITNVQVKGAEIRGRDYIGGVTGFNSGTIEKVSFRGVVSNDPHDTSSYAGGLVAYNTGTLMNSFSEGVVSTTSDNIGGIVGYNGGTVKIIYSTMALIPRQNGGGIVKAGGLLGSNASGGILADCFSDAVVRQGGMNSLTQHPIVASSDGGTATYSSCYTDNSQSYSPFIGQSYAANRDGTIPAGVTFTEGAGNWLYVADSIPHLAWETGRPCQLPNNNLTISSQISTLGRGTIANPITICNLTQLSDMSNRSPSLFYQMMEDINVSAYTLGSITNFYGEFNGNERMLYGLNASHDDAANQDNWGIFSQNYGMIKNLKVVGNHLINTDDQDTKIGILAGTNHGNISKVDAFGNDLRGEMQVGGLVGVNAAGAYIKDSNVEGNHILGAVEMGGVAGNNAGSILRVTSNNNIGVYDSSVSFWSIGGIAGVNLGNIDQTSVRGNITTASVAAAPMANIGGIVGDNQGNVYNSYVRSESNISIWDGKGVGGVVGSLSTSSAVVSNSFMLGRIKHQSSEGDALATLDTDNTTDERTIGPLVGYREPGSTISNSFYLPNVYLYDVSSQTISACPSAGQATVSSAPSASGGFRKSGGGGDTLGYYNFTRDSATQVSFNPAEYTCNVGDNLEFGLGLNNYAEHGTLKTQAGFATLADFLGAGFNILDGNSPAVINYYVSIMNGNSNASAGAPLWTLDANDAKHPKLLQVEH